MKYKGLADHGWAFLFCADLFFFAADVGWSARSRLWPASEQMAALQVDLLLNFEAANHPGHRCDMGMLIAVLSPATP